MNRPVYTHLLLATLFLLGLFAASGGLVACVPTPTPALPTATPTPVLPTPTPTPALPEGWVEHVAGDLTIWLPEAWEVLDISESDLQTIFADFEKNNPELAKIIGSAEALKGVSIWAFNTDSQAPGFIDNLNIRRTPLNGQPINDTQKDVLEPILAQYAQIGFQVSDSKADLEIGSQPAVRITYTFGMTGGDGKPITAEGQQYIVVTASDLWILSYTAGPGQRVRLEPVIEQSAQSFRAK
jgi:hypothetical protein